MKRQFRCPFCLKIIKTRELKFWCRKCRNFLPERKVSFWERIGLNSSPRKMVCPLCSNPTLTRHCPNCSNELPVSIDELPDMSIAIVGAQDSGKSHYIALLIKLLKELGDHFSLRALNDETIDRYEQQFYNPLFLRKTVIDKTQSGVARQDLTRPLLYSLTCKWSKRNILLAFFDTAGEDIENGVSNMETVNRYICTASGIICLLDPLQLEQVRRILSNKISSRDLPIKNMGTEKIVENVTILIQQYRMQMRQNAYAKIDIPMALAVSKIDSLVFDSIDYPLLFENDSPIFEESCHNGYLDNGDFTRINSFMHDWILEADEDIITKSDAFKEVAFFGFSALGKQTQSNGNAARTLVCTPRPCRVLDPFLWILWKNGLIPSK